MDDTTYNLQDGYGSSDGETTSNSFLADERGPGDRVEASESTGSAGSGGDSEQEIEMILRPRNVRARSKERHMFDDDDDSSTDSEEEEENRRAMREQDSDSSSSSTESENTQIWVPARNSTTLKVSRSKDQIWLPSSVSNTSMPSLPNGGTSVRNSMVSQSTTGRVETSLVIDPEPCGNGDSGIGNGSPETQSTVEHYPSHTEIRPATPGSMGSLEYRAGLCNGDVQALRNMQEAFRSSLFNILSGLYSIFVIILGAVLPIAEIFAQPVAINFFEAFYIYLYGVSIIFLIYVYAFLLQNATSEYTRKRAQQANNAHTAILEKSRKVSIDSSGSHHTGSFYLRLGAVGFGIGNMLLDGLRFGEFFEMDLSSPCSNILLAVRPMVHLVFTFVQLYFIFLNSKMCIHKYKVLARFGLMHMFATNICVWLRNLMKETLRELQHKAVNTSLTEYLSLQHFTPVHLRDAAGVLKQGAAEAPNYNISTNMTTRNPPILTLLDCQRRDIMGNVVDQAAPYLYPCAVQYSLIGSAILYTIWRNIGKRTSPLSTFYSTIQNNWSPKNKVQTQRPVCDNQRQIVDCQGSTKGLFVGILLLVVTIISMIAFFVLVEKPSYQSIAVIVVHAAEITLHLITAVTVLAAFFRVQDLYFNIKKDIGLDETLLLISLTGVYIFSIFSIVAGYYNTTTYGGTLIVVTGTLQLLESSLLTIFVLNGLRRRSYKPSHEESKPGRELVTFLLVCNIAMWGVNIFQTRRAEVNPVQTDFYGNLLWVIISHISTPLNIFFRFHAAVCLANIWRNAYKVKVK
ncbi:otopetrin-2 [Lingula anatina]|uniref:Otopetrin-2 n=1 Tax=Lingula anatina TaxID=7574 RepID=A0A1S3HXZ4_LINAN|nr:otopetrin-2 [Lingula anatina]|eukprot:XP_013390900.1 otopetrin-2 [Lingula anatina]